MSSPIYTATAGPADPEAPTRVKAYSILSALLGLIPVLTIFKVVTTEQGAAIGTFTQSAIGLAGAFGFAFVAKKTSNQVKNGTFDPAPPPVVVEKSPVGDAFQALSDIQAAVNDTVKAAQDNVSSAVSAIQGAVSMIPGMAGIANSPLVEDFLNRP